MTEAAAEIRAWRCSHCFKAFTTRELLRQPTVVYDSPTFGESPVNVCTCGKAFHRDTWRIKDRVLRPDGRELLVSTAALELNRFGMAWYETMVFDAKGSRNYCEHYDTQAEAEQGHHRACDAVRSGKVS